MKSLPRKDCSSCIMLSDCNLAHIRNEIKSVLELLRN